MKKIAIITHTDFINIKGEANAALNRIKHLKKIADYEIDAYNLYLYYGFIVRLLLKTKKTKRIESVNIDGVEIKYIWKKFSLINFILEKKLGFKGLFGKRMYRDFIEKLSNYDMISAHSYESGKIAMLTKQRYGVPYSVTWHGSDIHTRPYQDRSTKENTIKILNNASNNFFVSNALLEASNQLVTSTKKQILYNGVGDGFMRYDDEKKASLREKYRVSDKKVVAFIGGLVKIKNVLLLPEIFDNVKRKYQDKDLCFWIIGDGKQRQQLMQCLEKYDIECTLWGDQPKDKIPELMNITDVLILPSKNEGLPLVTGEALACGANVVGSKVGGIPEIIGEENAFDLNDNFISNISNRIVEMLRGEIKQTLSDKFSWEKTAETENKFYIEELNKI